VMAASAAMQANGCDADTAEDVGREMIRENVETAAQYPSARCCGRCLIATLNSSATNPLDSQRFSLNSNVFASLQAQILEICGK
jgi:hypothetical protein